MGAPYRSVETPLAIEAGGERVAYRPDEDEVDTIDLAGRDGSAGANGFSGSSGSSGSTDSNGNQGPGGDGTDGGPGGHGSHGTNARSARLVIAIGGTKVRFEGDGVAHVGTRPVFVDAHGGHGGSGGNGGSGGAGGSGNPSGRSGSDGRGGDGGDGGDGGRVVIETDDAHLLGLVASVDVSAGRGGRGGSGSPSGGRGRDGRDGAVELVVGSERDRRFGATPKSLVLAEDGRIDRWFTRGSPIVVRSVTVENRHGIGIPAPFELELAAEAPLEVTTRAASTQISLPARATRTIETTIRARVPEGCDLGWYGVRVDLRSDRGALRTRLTESRDVGVFEVGVNHRLVESEIETDGDHEALDRVRALCLRWNAESPAGQMAFFTAAVFASVTHAALDEGERARIGSTFEGRLLAPLPMWERYDELRADARRDVAFACALHFFAALPAPSREKVLDAAFHAASRDEILDASEKRAIRRMAARFGVDDGWLARKLPRVLEPGDSKIEPRRTNRVPALAAALLLVPCAMVVRGVVSMWLQEPARAARVAERTGGILDLAVFAAAAVLAFEPLRRGLLRTACASCESVEVEALESARGASMTGEGDAVRCTDCGARGSLDGGGRSFLQADCAPGREPPWLRIGIAAFVCASLAGAMHVTTAAPLRLRASVPSALSWAFVGSLLFLVLSRMRKGSWGWLLVAAIATIGFLVMLGS